uniref:Uncharacterized protein n=1 Tax=Rhizophora mucronata TaxID=61149 RepID=A0A2P2NZG1_RHIMU
MPDASRLLPRLLKNVLKRPWKQSFHLQESKVDN